MKQKISRVQARQRITELTETLLKSEKEYYQNSAPSIEDSVFDRMMQELTELEDLFPEFVAENSPVRRVGGNITPEIFERKKHRRPMLSLANIYTEDELEHWYTGLLKQTGSEVIELFCELKIDGVAISILFENRKLTEAVTRGNGKEGDLVTNNVAKIQDLPKLIDPKLKLEMRGEIYMSKIQFGILNRQRAKENLELFKNPRNTASGSLRMKNPQEVARRNLSLFIYDFISGEDSDRHDKNLELAGSLGFPINPYAQKVNSVKETLKFCSGWEKDQEKLPFEIDGVVIKVNSFALREKIGFRSKSPKWAVAWKFKMEQASTRLLSVENSIGRTGVLTPVANLEPLYLMGTVIKHASLHNYSQIKMLGICEKDMLIIEKGGEIIPKVVGTDISARIAGSLPLKVPKVCPSCNSSLVLSESKIDLKCINVNCPATLFGKLKHFVSKKATDIRSLGEANLQMLTDKKLIQSVADIYRLENREKEILELEGYAQKSVDNLLIGIRKSKTIPLERFLFALGIPGIGEKASQTLAQIAQTPQGILNLKKEDINGLFDFGSVTIESLLNWISNENNRKLIKELTDLGIRPKPSEKIEITKEETFVITGKLSKSREEWAQILERKGYKILKAVSKNATFLLCGEAPGNKAKKAEELGVLVLTEPEVEEKIKADD